MRILFDALDECYFPPTEAANSNNFVSSNVFRLLAELFGEFFEFSNFEFTLRESCFGWLTFLAITVYHRDHRVFSAGFVPFTNREKLSVRGIH